MTYHVYVNLASGFQSQSRDNQILNHNALCVNIFLRYSMKELHKIIMYREVLT